MRESRRLFRPLVVLATIAVVGPAAEAPAAVATGNIGVSITIEAQCQITDLNDLSFGTHGVITAAIPATTTIDVQCTDTTPFNIGLGPGNGTGATVAARLLGDTITYSLYTDLNHTDVWGDSIGSDTVAGTGDGIAHTYTIYGLVPVQTTPAPATYSDIVGVTVTY